ncbi:MAG: UDP-N-acetylmuramoyl-tripeptide--D-alanyl-D-alanine ligase [Pontiellaceae bacterium]
MINKSIERIATDCNGILKIKTNDFFSSFSKDTRTIKSGDIYIALKGENYDGHDYIKKAFDLGAVAAIANNQYIGTQANIIYVKDPLKALQKISIINRNKWNGEVIGITGSAGKTTVKELCSSILSQENIVRKTFANYNNQIGLPLTLTELEESDECLIAEIGMNKPGEIRKLAGWLKPNIAILTDLGLAHSAKFNSIEDIVHEKCGILEELNENDLAILDIDSPWFKYFEKITKANILTTSLYGKGDINGKYHLDDFLEINNEYYKLPQPGKHMARNTIKAIALAKYFKISLDNIVNGINEYSAPPMRWEKKIINKITWINDSYNANPLSMYASLNTFKKHKGKRKIAIIGKMHELGDHSTKQHKLLFDFLDNLNIYKWIFIGEWHNKSIYNNGLFIDNIDDTVMYLKKTLKFDDTVLLKASRLEGFEEILNNFK